MFEQQLGRSVTIDQAAALCTCRGGPIYNRIRDGKLQTIRTIGGSQRVLLSSLDENRRPVWSAVAVAAGAASTTSAGTRMNRSRPFGEERRMAMRQQDGVGIRSPYAFRSFAHAPSGSARRRGCRKACANTSRRNRQQPIDVIVHGIARRGRRHRGAPRAARQEAPDGRRRAAGETPRSIEALSADVDHLSRDVEVTSFMSVTNAAIGADQVQAGLAGLRPSRARASASRSSTRASGPATARSPAASSLRKISSAMRHPGQRWPQT